MYDSPLGYHRQLVLGANKNASDKFDMGYDAFMVDVNEEDMYWDVEGGKFVIQGVDNFDESQEFALGLIVKKDGVAHIKVEGIENMGSEKPLYIKDTTTNETFQINDNSFDIYLGAGTYDDRFKLVFKSSNNTSLSNNEPVLEMDLRIYYDSNSSILNITVNADANIFGGEIFNLMGQKITDIKGFAKQTSIPMHISTGAYIVQLNTNKGLVNKKIIVN